MIPGKGKACWRVLFFGTKGAVAFFQKIIERVLGEVSFSIVIVIYVDNILVGSMDLETHIQELKLIIEALTRAGLRLKPSKCKVGYLAIQFMGVVVDRERRGVDPHKVQVFVSMRKPRTGKEVQRVLGFLNFLRDFIPLYANIVGPLKKWRSARVISDGEWEKSGVREAFERAKKVLSNAPVLHHLGNRCFPVWGWGSPVSGGRGGEKVCGFCSQGVQQGAAELWSSEKGTFGWFVCDGEMVSMASIQKIHLGDGFEGNDIYQFVNKPDSLGLS